MIKINQMQIENVKRIKAVKIEPTQNGLTIIGGKNNQGKTSVLDSISWALGGNQYRPSAAQREESAIPPHLHIVLSNGLIVERKGKNSDLKVTDPHGGKGGQQLLNEFVEQLALDLPKFIYMSNREKADVLLQIIGVKDKLVQLELQETEIYNEFGAYDRWELKLGNKTTGKTSSLVKEWADLLLFANYKTFVVAADDKGTKYKGQGKERVMYTSHHPAWDAKNRHGLPDELPFEYMQIAHCVPNGETHTSSDNIAQTSDSLVDTEKTPEKKTQDIAKNIIAEESPVSPGDDIPFLTSSADPVKINQEPPKTYEQTKIDSAPPSPDIPTNDGYTLPPDIPKALSDLMKINRVGPGDIQTVVAQKGYYPIQTPISRYDPEFINGVLVGAWPQVLDVINKNRGEEEKPF